MQPKDQILQFIQKNGPSKSSKLSKLLGISRQSTAAHLRSLVQNGKLIKTGSTKSSTYELPRKGLSKPEFPHLQFNRQLKGLEEDRVFQEVDIKLRLKKWLNDKAYSIFTYAFTEMLNNAIDHSDSKTVQIEVKLSPYDVKFLIRDSGIGLFSRVAKTFYLKDEFEALEHVLKGKQTTYPERHSGQGIFFTSKIADEFLIRSHKLQLKIDNQISDAFVKEDRFLKGTEIQFRIKKKTRKNLKELFEQYANDDFEFDKTRTRVKLLARDGYISRSQAKRLLFGIEKFDRIVFDFAAVKEVGQGFVDEIFRVFKNSHPKIALLWENANPAVQFMIERAIKSRN